MAVCRVWVGVARDVGMQAERQIFEDHGVSSEKDLHTILADYRLHGSTGSREGCLGLVAVGEIFSTPKWLDGFSNFGRVHTRTTHRYSHQICEIPNPHPTMIFPKSGHRNINGAE